MAAFGNHTKFKVVNAARSFGFLAPVPGCFRLSVEPVLVSSVQQIRLFH